VGTVRSWSNPARTGGSLPPGSFEVRREGPRRDDVVVDDAEHEDVLRERIAALTPDRFEQFVFALAHREDERVERLQHPDGGADTLLPRGDGTADRVWQAKRYPGDVNWDECEKSLADAIANWRPARVTFVFPRNLSKTLRKSFDTRLVAHADAEAAKVAVDHWNLSHIIELLAHNRDIAARYWPDLESQTDKLDRVIKAGGKLESSEDLVERAKALADFAERDKNFRSQYTIGGLDSETANFDNLPFMTIDLRGERTRLQIATYIRDGADVAPPAIAFTDDETGQTARIAAVRKLARGETATVTGGFRVAIVAPEIMKELTKDAEIGGGSFDLLPGDPLEISVEFDVEGDTMSYPVALRPVPPAPGAKASWAGFVGRTLVELSFTLLEKPALRSSLQITGELEGSAAERAETARLLHAFYSHDAMRIRSDTLFPGGVGVITGNFERLGNDAFVDTAGVLAEFFADLAFLEERLGIEIAIPPGPLSEEDFAAVGTMAEVLRTGEGTATFGAIEVTVENPGAIPGLIEQFKAQGSTIEDCTYPLFGREISLGLGEYPIPPLKLVKVAALGTTPNAPARVRLDVEGDGEVTFRLLGSEPTSE
jgi:hypothetical protein